MIFNQEAMDAFFQEKYEPEVTRTIMIILTTLRASNDEFVNSEVVIRYWWKWPELLKATQRTIHVYRIGGEEFSYYPK